ncbi:MAG TPA: DUF1499 domain-containing protein [Pirellulales bacterium]|nr:DUF1499 domain-containing protein [Pirellulales bacterium]
MFSSGRDHLGASGGRLSGCPKSPNCVSTQATDAGHHIAPLPFEGAAEDAMDRIILVATKMRGLTLALRQEGYLHFECRSRLFGFIDDLEFFVEPNGREIQIRSASRLGYSDLGVNRARVKKIRQAFTAGGGLLTRER